MGTIESTMNTMEKQMKLQKNTEKSQGESKYKCSVMTDWRMRLRPHVREAVTSLSLGRNIKMAR